MSAYISEESAEGPIIIEGQRQRANGTRSCLQLNRHVHRNLECRMMRALDRIGDRDFLTRLVAEQVDGVRGVMPEEMIGPRARLPQGIYILATKKIGLNIHLQDLEFAVLDSLMHPLMRRVEPPGMPDHTN